MLNILHIYDESNSMAAQYVAMLVKAVGDRATMCSATNAKAFKTLLAEQRPDIVHLHSKSPFALPSDIRLVVTPHGEPSPLTTHLQPSTFNIQPSHPTPYVLIARSKMERDELIRQFPRVETILNPIITRTTTPEACARQMLYVYQRVMDSNVLQLMDDDTRQTLALILGTAVAGDARWVEPLTASSYRESQKGASYRQLYIYAEHEGILPLVEQGISMLGISTPPMERVESYLPEGYVKPRPMTGSDIVALTADIKANGPTLLRLSEIARALRDPQLDEQLLLQRLDDGNLQGKNLRPLFASILQLLSEQFLLTEGFMPCPPADNRETQQLRRMLEQHGCI